MNINLKKIYKASKFVEKISKIPISPLKPVVGDFVFKRESGVTAAQVISFPPSVEPYSPELLGTGAGSPVEQEEREEIRGIQIAES